MEKLLKINLYNINQYIECQQSIKLLFNPFYFNSGTTLTIFYTKSMIILMNKYYKNNLNLGNIYFAFEQNKNKDNHQLESNEKGNHQQKFRIFDIKDINNLGNYHLELRLFESQDKKKQLKKKTIFDLKKKKIFDLGLILFYLKYKNNLYPIMSEEIIKNQIIDEAIEEMIDNILSQVIQSKKNKPFIFQINKNNEIINNENSKNEKMYETEKIFDINERIIAYIKSRKLSDEKISNFINSLIDPKDRPSSLQEISTNKLITEYNQILREKKLAFQNDKQKFIKELQKYDFNQKKITGNTNKKYAFKKKRIKLNKW